MAKKVLFILPFLLIFFTGFAQTLNQNANWPNANWTITGSFTSGALLSDPTVAGTQFQFDDQAVNAGADNNNIAAESPVINLQPAFDNGETGIFIFFQVAFTISNQELLAVEIFDADANGGNGDWAELGAASDETEGDYTTCTLGSDPNAEIIMSIENFTTNQLQNFRYRLVYDNMSTAGNGFCVYSPLIFSFSCVQSTNIMASNIGPHSADITWTSTNDNTYENLEWTIEYGPQGFTQGNGTMVDDIYNTTSYSISNLTPNTAYDVYIKDDCSFGEGTVESGWSGPYTFSTAVLGLDENTIEGFSWHPNPVSDTIELNAQQNIDKIVVYDILGKEVMRSSPGTISTSIDMGAKPQGWYFLKVSIADKVGAYKIYKE